MAYTTPITFVALSTLTAAQLNSIQSNISALWPYTAAGDIPYATSSSVLSALAKGTAGQALIMGASLPEWGETGISKRQGGSSTDWSDSSNVNNYTPSGTVMQCGSARMTVNSGTGAVGTVTITFPSAFSYAPVIVLGVVKLVSGSLSFYYLTFGSISNSSFVINLTVPTTPMPGVVTIPWLAMGI